MLSSGIRNVRLLSQPGIRALGTQAAMRVSSVERSLSIEPKDLLPHYHPMARDITVGDFITKKSAEQAWLNKIEKVPIPQTSIEHNRRVIEAVKVLGTNNIGAIVVTKHEMVAGILTERDYARKVALKGLRSENISCEDIMTPNPDVVSLENSIDDAMTMLFHGKYRHLPVVKHAGNLCPTSGNPLYPQGKKHLQGILSITDMLRLLNSMIKPAMTAKANAPSLRDAGRLCAQKPFIVLEHDSVFQAISVMEKRNVGSLVVVNDHAEMTGIITERDYLQKVVLHGKSSEKTPVCDIMTPDPICADTNLNVTEALNMLSLGFRHLPLLSKDSNIGPYHAPTGQRCVGMLSSKDIVRYIYGDE